MTSDKTTEDQALEKLRKMIAGGVALIGGAVLFLGFLWATAPDGGLSVHPKNQERVPQ